jgi:hypothetical protein
MADDLQARDQTLQLIGLFFVNFSRYVSHLEAGLSMCMGFGDARVNGTLYALTGRMEERALRGAFFKATALVRDPTALERKIRKALDNRAQALATRRNDLAHGIWLFSSAEGEASYKPSLRRESGNVNEAGDRTVVSSREDIAVLAQEAEDVALLVWEYISGLFTYGNSEWPGVSARLGFNDEGKLVRLLRY